MEKKNKKTLKINSIRPSSIIESNYLKKLTKIIRKAKYSINDLIKNYHTAKTDPNYISIISNSFKNAFNDWGDKFDYVANEIASDFVNSSLGMVDRKLTAEFRKNQLSIQFQMTNEMKAKIEGKIAENVNLIRSIPQQYLSDVQGAVMRSIERGSDLKTLTEILRYRHGVTERRARIIASDQTNKASAIFTRQRHLDVGITKGEWVHSGLGKDKRASHVKAGRDKLIFDLKKGAYIDGEYIFPSELINCRCTWRAVLFDGNSKQN